MKNRKKLGAVLSALVIVLYLAGIIAFAVMLLTGNSGLGGAPAVILIAYAVIGGAVAVGVTAALRQRLREIDGGEEEEAKKY